MISWRDKAACLGMDTNLFFPPKHGASKQARRICADCPVVSDCLEWAVENSVPYGIWGGLSRSQRKEWARQQRG